MAGVEALDFDPPDETRTPDKTRVDVIRVGGTTAARMTFEAGWEWSECVKPVVGTDSCQAEVGPGDAYVIEPGHDAWVVGAESFVGSSSRRARPRSTALLGSTWAGTSQARRAR